MSKLTKIIIFLYYVLLFATPLVMSSYTSELFEFNKMIFIYLITALILFFWLLKMVVAKKIIIKKTPFDIPIILFLISQILSTVFSIDRHTSFFGYYGRFNGGLLSIITYIILFYGFVSNFSLKSTVEKIFKISLFSSLLVILWGLPGKLGYDLSCFLFMGQLNNSCWTTQFKPHERMFSTLGQPNWLGAYLAINFFIAFYFYLKNTKIDKNVLLTAIYLLLNFSAILFTRSRSALGATFFCFFLLIFGYAFYLLFLHILKKVKDNQKNIFITIKLLVFSFFIIFVPTLVFKTGIEKIDKHLTPSFKARKGFDYQTAKINTNSANRLKVTSSIDIRKIVWQGAVDLGKRYPFFGTGVETFAYAYYFVRPKEHNLTSEWDYLYNKAHNEYLNYLATTGLIGLATYLILNISVILFFLKNIFLPAKQLDNSKNESLPITSSQLLTTCLLLAYLSILITNFFGFSTTTINLFFFLIPGFQIIYHQKETKLSTEEEKFSFRALFYQNILSLILLAGMCYLVLLIFFYWYADTLYAKADYLSKANQYQEAANYLNQALKLKYEHVYEDKLSYVLANLAAIASSYKRDEKIIRQLTEAALFYNQKAILASPKNVLYWKTKAKNHYLFYQIDLDKNQLKKGIEALKQASIISPTDPKIPYTLALFYSLLFDHFKSGDEKIYYQRESLNLINQAIDLKPDMIEFYLFKGELLKKYQMKNEAKEVYRYILNNLDSNNQEAKKELGIN